MYVLVTVLLDFPLPHKLKFNFIYTGERRREEGREEVREEGRKEGREAGREVVTC